MDNAWYRNEARRLFALKREDAKKPALVIDDDAVVSKGTEDGAWIQVWAWIPKGPERPQLPKESS